MCAAGGIVGEYESLRSQTDADLVAMQVGDFYEFFDECADVVHDELDLQLSTKPSGGEQHRMAGVPVSEIDRYVQALVERGYRVAVADQVADDGSHRRAIERVVTPGTTLDRIADDATYLAAVVMAEGTAGIALVDVASGRCFADSPHRVASTEDLVEILAALDVAEVLLGPDLEVAANIDDRLEAAVTRPDPAVFDARSATARLREHFGDEIGATLDLDPVSARAVGVILGYLESTDQSLLACVSRLERYRADARVTLDATTQRNLELTETFRGERDGSLLGTIDHTVTAAGRRHLRDWLHRPIRTEEELIDRLDGIAALVGTPLVRDELRDLLKGTNDLDRLATRCAHGSANPHDLGLLRDTLERLPDLVDIADNQPELRDSPIVDLLDDLSADAIGRCRDRLREALVDEPPRDAGGGGIFRTGWDGTLDEVIERHEELRDWFAELPERERRRHGIDDMELGHTKAEGYFLQVPSGQPERVPDEYDHVKTVAAGTRYRTEELDRKERTLVQVEDRRSAMEQESFEQLRADVAAVAGQLRACGRVVAGLDVRVSLAQHAARNDWTRPTFRNDDVIEIDRGRHPVVEQTTRFVPNDCRFDDRSRQLLVTGPNMSGKSTFLRQVALITLLAQIGSFVPADRAAITPVDGIYTRVGALDELAEGRSTFMVEMQELGRILHQATADSLVILDEVGRGTATYDGLSIAWAATEYLHNSVRAKALFATHYHELTVLGDHLEGVANVHVAVDESDDGVVFLRTVEPGPTDRSYGINVADMAGVPDAVVDRAGEVLDRLRSEKAVEARAAPDSPTQVVFDLERGRMRRGDSTATTGAERSILKEIVDLDLDNWTPVDLMRRVRTWQEQLDKFDD